MKNTPFSYRTTQGKPFKLSDPLKKIEELELDYTKKLIRKFGETLINPRVEVIISDNGANIIRRWLFADARLS